MILYRTILPCCPKGKRLRGSRCHLTYLAPLLAAAGVGSTRHRQHVDCRPHGRSCARRYATAGSRWAKDKKKKPQLLVWRSWGYIRFIISSWWWLPFWWWWSSWWW